MWFTLQTWHPCCHGYSPVLVYPTSTKLKNSISTSESSYQMMVLDNTVSLYLCYWPQNIELLSWLLLPTEMVAESNIQPVVLQHQGAGHLRWMRWMTSSLHGGELEGSVASQQEVWGFDSNSCDVLFTCFPQAPSHCWKTCTFIVNCPPFIASGND